MLLEHFILFAKQKTPTTFKHPEGTDPQSWVFRPGNHLVFYSEAEPEEHICFRDIKPTPKRQTAGEHLKLQDLSREFCRASDQQATV